MVYPLTVSVGGNGICMKLSGNNALDDPALTNVLIADCTVLQGHGDIRNIWATDYRFIGTASACK